MRNKREIKIYNVIFPIWMLWVFPMTWLIVLPANFIIDSAVILIALKLLKVDNSKVIYKKTILKVWIFGFLSDFIGSVIMIISGVIKFSNSEVMREWWYNNIEMAVFYNPFQSFYGFLWVTLSVIISSIFIYIFNLKISFNNLEIEESTKKKLALALAIFTAPILFYLPTSLFF